MMFRRGGNRGAVSSDAISLLLSLGFAALSLLLHGWTLNGLGPAILAAAGGFWQFWMHWLRHLSWRRHRDSGFVPGTQHLAICAWLGWSAAELAAVIWAGMALSTRRFE